MVCLDSPSLYGSAGQRQVRYLMRRPLLCTGKKYSIGFKSIVLDSRASGSHLDIQTLKYNPLGHQGSTLRKNFISPAGLVTVTFTSPEIFLLALAYVISMKRIVYCVKLSYIIIQVCRAKGGFHHF